MPKKQQPAVAQDRPASDDEENDGLSPLETSGRFPSVRSLIPPFLREALKYTIAAVALCFVMYDETSAFAIPCLYFLQK